jgi:hypothetical protein
MEDLELKLETLEHCLRQFNKGIEIVFNLITTDYRGQTPYDTLRKMEDIVKELNDEHLLKLYKKLFEEGRSPPHVYRQISLDDYFAFLARLNAILNEVAVQANEADIALRQVIGLQSVIGIWGGRSWRPLGKSTALPSSW